MAITDEVLNELPKDYQKPEDLPAKQRWASETSAVSTVSKASPKRWNRCSQRRAGAVVPGAHGAHSLSYVATKERKSGGSRFKADLWAATAAEAEQALR